MSYGFDAYVLVPPYSLLVSVLLLLACDMVGNIFLRTFKLKLLIGSWVRLQAPLFGLMLLAILVYPMALMGLATLSNLRLISSLLILMLGAHFILRLAKIKLSRDVKYIVNYGKNLLATSTVQDYMVYVILLGYFIFALSPVTNADSLNYHAGVALEVLRYGFIPISPEWFNGRLFGNEEILNALGLSVGAEQFGSLIQFVSLLSIYSIIRYSNIGNQRYTSKQFHVDWRRLLSIVIISSPVLISLVGSYKPQLMPIAMTTLALAMITGTITHNYGRKTMLTIYATVMLLIMVASQAKFTYMLGGGVVGIVAISVMYRKGLLKYAVPISLLLFSIVMLPPVIWKMYSYGGGIIESFLTPLPGGWPGTDNFENMLRNAKDNNIFWPLSLLLPGSIHYVTTVIGLASLAFVFIRKTKDISLQIIYASAIFVFVVSAFVGPSTSRSYLEPIIWLSLGLANQYTESSSHILHKKYTLAPIFMQYFFAVIMVYYGVTTSIAGAISQSSRVEIMGNLAPGYKLMRWVDEMLPNDAVLLSYHVSTALVPRESSSLRWINYTDKDDRLEYFNRNKDKNVSHLLLMGDYDNYKDTLQYSIFSECVGNVVYGPKVFSQRTRNPFNRGGEQNAWLVDLDVTKMPGCVDAD